MSAPPKRFFRTAGFVLETSSSMNRAPLFVSNGWRQAGSMSMPAMTGTPSETKPCVRPSPTEQVDAGQFGHSSSAPRSLPWRTGHPDRRRVGFPFSRSTRRRCLCSRRGIRLHHRRITGPLEQPEDFSENRRATMIATGLFSISSATHRFLRQCRPISASNRRHQ